MSIDEDMDYLERELSSQMSYFEDNSYHLISFKEAQDLALAVRDFAIDWLARSSVVSPLEGEE